MGPAHPTIYELGASNQPRSHPQSENSHVRLPGIETFDHVSGPEESPASNSMNGNPHALAGHTSWDMSLHRNLPKLDIESQNAAHTLALARMQAPTGGRDKRQGWYAGPPLNTGVVTSHPRLDGATDVSSPIEPRSAPDSDRVCFLISAHILPS